MFLLKALTRYEGFGNGKGELYPGHGLALKALTRYEGFGNASVWSAYLLICRG